MKTRNRIEWADIDIFCIVRFVVRRFWLVILAALIALMSVYLAESLVLSPKYSSQTNFALTSRSAFGSGASSVAATNMVAAQFGKLLESDIVCEAAAKRMGLEEFPASISIEVPENTNIITMTTTADSPELAYKSALAIIDCHGEYSQRVFATTILDSINGPLIPLVASNLTTRDALMRFSAPIGAVIMIAILVMMSVQADTVQTTAGAKHQIDGNMLATVYHERNHRNILDALKRKKKSLLITNPTCSFYYTETIHQLRVLVERDREQNHHRVFLITSCSENEGKSTIAANIALSLAQKHQRVLLVDADLRKPAQHLIFETPVTRGKDFASLLSGGFSEKTLLDCIHHSETSGVYCLFTDTLRRRKMEMLSAESFLPLITALRKHFQYIILDTPPLGFFADAEIMAGVADASILVVRQDIVSAIAINDAIDTLGESRAAFLGYVLNNLRSFRAFSLRSTHSGYGYGYGYGYGHGYGYGYGYGYGKDKSKGKSNAPVNSDGKEVRKNG